jgi:hypothetical protein
MDREFVASELVRLAKSLVAVKFDTLEEAEAFTAAIAKAFVRKKRERAVSDAWYESTGNVIAEHDGREFSIGTDDEGYDFGDSVDFWITDLDSQRQKKVVVTVTDGRDVAKQIFKVLKRM